MPNLIDLLVATKSEKAKGKGGFGGLMGKLGYTAPGHGVRDVKKPGSRGGHPWTDANGGVHYGPQPQGRGHSGSEAKKPAAGTRARVGAAGPKKPAAKKPMTAHNHPANFKRQTPEARVTARRKMLTSLNKTYRTGVDPHGNPMNEKQLAQVKLLRAALSGELKAHRAANPPVSRKKEIAQAIAGEVKAQIAEKAAAHLPFTVFKDAKGQWRWIGVSSSSAEDADQETVSLKALQADTAMKDVTGKYGPLNWWHTSIELGTCDFNAMDGPLLVESGTFYSEKLAKKYGEKAAQAISEKVARSFGKAIADGTLKPGMSLEFEHSEPGLTVQPGRVFTRINKVGRALLPAEKASNLLTSFKVYSLKNTSAASAGESEKKESKKMLTEEKYKKLESILPPELLEGLLSGNEVAVKSAELAGYSFKAMTPPQGKGIVNAAQEPVPPADTTPLAPKKKLDTKAGPMDNMAGMMADEGSPAEELGETPAEEGAEQEGAFEDSPADDAADAIMQSLYDQIDQIVQSRLEAASKDILAALSGVNDAATATKEVSELLSAQTLALKDNTTALNTVVAENKSLKARLDALEGKQPAAVRARASQGAGLSAEQLREADKDLVNPAQKEVDPYAKIVEQLGLIPFSKGAV